MRNKNVMKRPLAALLALVLAMTMTPVAMAETVICPNHSGQVCTETIIKKPNCHEEGVAEYSCPLAGCSYKGQLKKLNMDPSNHEGVYTDNGNGTHSGVCNYALSHAAGIRIDGETHTYDATGKCEKCGAYNYGQVVLDLPDRTVPVALNDADAKLTAGDIKLVLGSADITKDYDLNYSWYYQGNQVSTSAECPLPVSVYGKEGVYYYNLYIMAIPKGSTTRQPVSESCTVTVQVEELVSASAIITTEYTTLRMDEADDWSADSISSQIYEAAKSFCGRNADPYYVTFTTSSKTGTTVGDLEVTNNIPYYFSRIGNCLDDVIFRSNGVAGDYTIAFTVTDTAKKSYTGLLTITVQQYVGNMDVVYIASRDEAFNLASEDFEAFWAKVNPRGVLDYISFNETPRSVDGSLYAGYTSQALPGDRVRTSDLFYVEPGRNEYGIEEVTFLPGVAQSGYITLSFTAYGSRGSGYSSRRDGTIYIFFANSAQSADITLTVSSAGTPLDPAAFQKAYQSATGGAGASFYIQLLDVPASGALYTGRTSTKQGVRLTETAIEGRPFAYNGSLSETISSLSYVPGTAAAESIRYVASSAQGKPLYAGKITFTTSGTGTTTPTTSTNRISYTCGASGIALKASDFENLPGANAPKLNMVKFTLPSAAYGTLYLNRTTASVGTPLTNKDEWYSVTSTAVANSVNNITFVPASGYVGLVTINFEALNNSGDRSSGSVQITVTSSTTTTTTPSTPTNLPAKTFPDVPAYYQPYISDLTSKGVINGYEDGTFRPDDAVKLGEVLKLIMLSVGYPEQASTGKHWASGYLTKALEDGLLPANLLEIMGKLKNREDILDRIVSRYEIAVITAKGMNLPLAAVTASPFSDMAVSESAAPYVMALYNIGVLIGTGNADSNPYQGTMAIRRKDISVIVWRVRNYVETGNVNGTTVTN